MIAHEVLAAVSGYTPLRGHDIWTDILTVHPAYDEPATAKHFVAGDPHIAVFQDGSAVVYLPEERLWEARTP